MPLWRARNYRRSGREGGTSRKLSWLAGLQPTDRGEDKMFCRPCPTDQKGVRNVPRWPTPTWLRPGAPLDFPERGSRHRSDHSSGIRRQVFVQEVAPSHGAPSVISGRKRRWKSKTWSGGCTSWCGVIPGTDTWPTTRHTATGSISRRPSCSDCKRSLATVQTTRGTGLTLASPNLRQQRKARYWSGDYRLREEVGEAVAQLRGRNFGGTSPGFIKHSDFETPGMLAR